MTSEVCDGCVLWQRRMEYERYRAALLEICTANKDAKGLREIAIAVLNGEEVK